MVALNRRSRIVLDTLLPAGTDLVLAKGALEAGFEEFYRDFDATAATGLRIGFKGGMLAAVWVSPLLIGRIPPVTIYKRETRERALEALARSRLYPLRQLFAALKLTVALCYGADRDIRDTIGYPLQHDDPRRQGTVP